MSFEKNFAEVIGGAIGRVIGREAKNQAQEKSPELKEISDMIEQMKPSVKLVNELARKHGTESKAYQEAHKKYCELKEKTKQLLAPFLPPGTVIGNSGCDIYDTFTAVCVKLAFG